MLNSKILNTLMLVLLPFSLFSQSAKISGTILEDSNSEVMSWVNVLLIEQTTGKVLKGKTSDENGTFVFYGLKPKKYKIEISFIGFQQKEIIVEIASDSTKIDIGEVRLLQSATALDDVVIVAERPTLIQDGGKTVLNVSESLGQSSTMVDLLDNIPSIQASEEEGINIRGQKPILLIDGVESSADEFNSLSPSIISSIEVQTNASAKYSGSKVINVVLNSKSYQKQMYRGQVFYGTDDYFKGQFNGVYRKDKWSFSGGGYYQNKNFYKTQSLQREFDTKDQILHQEKRDSINAQRIRLFANISYKLNNRNRFNFRSSFISTNDNPLNYLDNKYENPGNRGNLRLNINDNTKQSYNLLGMWQHKLDDGAEFELSAKWQKQPSYRVNNASTNYPNTTINTKLDRYIFDEDKEFAYLKIDYVKSINSDFTIETGAETRLTHNNMYSEVSRFDYINNEWVDDTDKSYNYVYEEQKYTGYFSALYNVNNWEFNVGLRAEYIHWDSMIPDLDSTFSKDIFVPSPIIGVNYNLTEKQSIGFSLSRRVTMPRYTDLNPHTDASNPDVLRSGNPDLNPPISWNFELNHSYNSRKFSNSISLFYRNEQDKISRVFTPTINDNVFLSRPENISEAISYGFDISQKIKILKNWNASTYFAIYQYKLNGDNLDERAETEGLMGSFKINTSLKLPYNFRIGGTYNYIGQKLVVNGRVSPTSYLNLNLFKSMFDKRLQLSLKANDILQTRKTSHVMYVNGSYSEFDRSFNSRMIIIGASYKFDK